MARISVVGTPFNNLLLKDLSNKQQLREQTIHPQGEERYLEPIDKDAVEAKLQEVVNRQGSGNVTSTEVNNFISGTVGDGTGSGGSGDNISESNIDTVAQADVSDITGALNSSEKSDLKDLLSVKFTEEGDFKLSFKNGIVNEAKSQGWIKVFTDAGSSSYTL